MTTQTVLTVGPGEQFSTISAALVAAYHMGGNADIRVDPGDYVNDGGYITVDNVTLEGVGGMARISTPPYSVTGRPAGIETSGHNVLLKNLEIYGATTNTISAAGVRYDKGTLTLDHVLLRNNNYGIFGANDPAGSITIKNSTFSGNGANSTGFGANIDIGEVALLTLVNSDVNDPRSGAEIRSRADNTIIANNVIADTFLSTYSIDLANGGNAIIAGNVIDQSAWNTFTTVLTYGQAGHLHPGKSVDFSDNVIVNDNPSGAGPLWSNQGATITGSGNTAYNLLDLGAGVNPTAVSALASRPDVRAAEAAKQASIAASTHTSTTLHPAISAITGVPYTGVRLTGTAEAGSTVALTDTSGGHTILIGSATVSPTGAFSFLSNAGLGHIDLSAIHKYGVTAWNDSGATGAMPGALWLTDIGRDTITGAAGATDIFAIMSNLGADMINGFQTAVAVGANHDIIDFSGRGITSFTQVQPLMSGSADTIFTLAGGKTVTLAGVAPTTLTAADFRFS